MANLRVAATGLSSFVYWALFIFACAFVTFFLNSMIDAANAEESGYNPMPHHDISKIHSEIEVRHASTTTVEGEEGFDDFAH